MDFFSKNKFEWFHIQCHVLECCALKGMNTLAICLCPFEYDLRYIAIFLLLELIVTTLLEAKYSWHFNLYIDQKIITRVICIWFSLF